MIYPVNYWMPAHNMDVLDPPAGYLTDSKCKDVWGYDVRTCFEECDSKQNPYTATQDSYRVLIEDMPGSPISFRETYQVKTRLSSLTAVCHHLPSRCAICMSPVVCGPC